MGVPDRDPTRAFLSIFGGGHATTGGMKLFGQSSGGYRHLNLFALATIIQLDTIRFCGKFLDARNDPKGRLYDQMTQAARSGRANIMEGSARGSTSRQTEINLTGVALASLVELLGDYEMWLMAHGQLPWTGAEAAVVKGISLDPSDFHSADLLHDSCAYYLAQRAKFAQWLDSDNPCTAAQCLLVLLGRVQVMLTKHLQAQEEQFKETGGLRENMTAARLEARHAAADPTSRRSDDPSQPPAPACPQCGKAMRRRTPRGGGDAFWGCSDFPRCKATREIES